MGKTFEEHAEYSKVLKSVAKVLHETFNPKVIGVEKTGFALIVFRDSESDNTDMVTNLETDYVKMALEDILKTIDK